MRKYTPRRQTSRWLDGDCPAGVLAIYDNPKFADRYMVFYTEVMTLHNGDHWISYRGMSESPTSPQGVGMYGEMTSNQAASYRHANRNRACKWSTLPQAVKNCVIRDLELED